MQTVYILCADYGCEGLQEPFIAFVEEQEAIDAQNMLALFPANQSTKIVKAPFYFVSAVDVPPPSQI